MYQCLQDFRPFWEGGWFLGSENIGKGPGDGGARGERGRVLLLIDLQTRCHLSEYLASLDGVIHESLLLAKQATAKACFKTL